MFEQTFLAEPARARTGWSMMISLTVQVSLVGTALLVPLVHPDLLPASVAPWDIRIAPPPGRPAPPPPPETAPRARVKAAPSQVRNNALLAPTRIPEKPELIIDEEQTLSSSQQYSGPWVEGMRGEGPVGNNAPSVIKVAPPPPPPQTKPVEQAPKQPIRIKQGGEVQHGRIISQVTPKYPPLAIQTRIQGKVTFTAVISTQGQIMNLQVLSGHPMLVPAATEAVRQWRYKPTLLNGDPVEVVTVIEVTFTLNR